MIYGTSLFLEREDGGPDDIEIRTKQAYLKALEKELDRAFGTFIVENCKNYIKTGEKEYIVAAEARVKELLNEDAFIDLVDNLLKIVAVTSKKISFKMIGLDSERKTLVIVLKIMRDYITDKLIYNICNKHMFIDSSQLLSRKYFEALYPIATLLFFIDIKLCEFIRRSGWPVRDIVSLVFRDVRKIRKILTNYRIRELDLYSKIRKESKLL